MAMAHEDYHSREEEIEGSSNRSFGLVFAGFFLLLGLFPLWKGGQVRTWALGLSGLFLVLALALPGVLAPLNKLWTKLGLLLAKITNPIITAILFFLVFTPFAIGIRLLGKDLLRLKRSKEIKSYWLERTPPGPAPDSMANQF